MAKFCKYCGDPITEGEAFCDNCGKPIEAPPPPPMPDGKPDAPQSAAAFPLTQSLGAAAAPGEVDCGVIQLPGLAPVQQAAEKVLSPLGGIFSTLGSFLGGVFGILRSPGAFIGTALMAGFWFVLAQLRESGVGADTVEPLSWFTFAQGGFGRTGAGTVGGIFGMGAVAAMFGTLLSGGMIDAFKGIGALFVGHGERRSLFCVVIGVVLGGALYFAFAGKYASADTAMAGIAGAVLSLEMLGAGDGPIYTLVQSLTSRARNGVRTAVQGRCDGLFTGLTLGFAIATALTSITL